MIILQKNHKCFFFLPDFGSILQEAHVFHLNDVYSCVCVILLACVLAFEDIRGFVNGGYRELNNNEGPLNSLVCEEKCMTRHILHLNKRG